MSDKNQVLTSESKDNEEILRLNAELEQRVRERTAQLEAANKELEAFAYSVSHDLRAPLRSVRGFSEVLLERYSDRLDAAGKEFLNRICQSSAHMDRLIEDLLKFSRISRAELHRQPVDLSSMVQNLCDDLAKADPQRDVKFAVESGITVSGDERLLRIAMDNLVRNAWKFSGKKESARIEFGSVQAPEQAYYVRDNGAGFDMRYAGKLFRVFQRLHSTAEFPGTGIGLATVQRIIHRHGGRVWADAAVDQGATFFLSLPQEGSA
jgi:light-regulated signal transduction histidine kinase (bacteriophytochrome)